MRIVILPKRVPRLLLTGVLSLVFFLQSGSSQESTPGSRQETIAAKQLEKAAETPTPKVDKFEMWFERAQQIFLEDPSGWYPYFGSVYHGGGFTLGSGFRQYFADHSFWDVKG